MDCKIFEDNKICMWIAKQEKIIPQNKATKYKTPSFQVIHIYFEHLRSYYIISFVIGKVLYSVIHFVGS